MENIKEVEIVNPYGFIYITTNMINGKKYIGQRRFYKGWKIYLGSGKLLRRAFKKYNKENFYKNIVAIAYSKEELDELEIEFIKIHNAVESDDYYNISFCDQQQLANEYNVKQSTISLVLNYKGAYKSA